MMNALRVMVGGIQTGRGEGGTVSLEDPKSIICFLLIRLPVQ